MKWISCPWRIFWLAFLAILIAGIWFVPELQVNTDIQNQWITADHRPEILNEYRRTAIQFAGGLLLIAGLFFTYSRIKEAEEANRINEEANKESQRLNRETLRITEEANRETQRLREEGQVTERFTRAIEQLGSEDMAIRLGGIYALERIARDSEKDHWTVMEVLGAFVRANATEEANTKLELDPNVHPDIATMVVTGWEIRIDIEAALTVIGRREERPEPGSIDLHEVWLCSYLFEGSRFDDINFHGAVLREARFDKSSMRDVRFIDADLSNSTFFTSDLANAWLRDAILHETRFIKCCLNGVDFCATQDTLRETRFTNCQKMYQASFLRGQIIGNRSTIKNFVGSMIDHFKYEEGMPDLRDQDNPWPPTDNWGEEANTSQEQPTADGSL